MSKLYEPKLPKRLKNKVAKLKKLKTEPYQISDGAILISALNFSSCEKIREKFGEYSEKFRKEYYLPLIVPEPHGLAEDQRYGLVDRLGDYFVQYKYMDQIRYDGNIFYRTTFEGRIWIDHLIKDKEIFDLFRVKLEPLE